MQGMAPRLTSLLRLCAAAGLATALFTTATANAATIYKSVDERGNVQFSQTPPKDRPSETISAGRMSTGGAASVDPVTDAPTGAQTEAASDRATDPTTEIKVFDRDQAREACQQAREQREAVADSGNQLMVEDEDGKYQPMTPAQRQERLKRLDAIIEEACTAAGDD